RIALRLAPMGLGAGFAAGFFGIGGGFLIVPGLMAATGMTLMHAQASSLLSVAVFGASTSANYAVSGLVDWNIVLAMVAGGAAGTAIGLPIARRLGERAALGRRLFAGLIILVAIYVAVRAIGGSKGTGTCSRRSVTAAAPPATRPPLSATWLARRGWPPLRSQRALVL